MECLIETNGGVPARCFSQERGIDKIDSSKLQQIVACFANDRRFIGRRERIRLCELGTVEVELSFREVLSFRIDSSAGDPMIPKHGRQEFLCTLVVVTG